MHIYLREQVQQYLRNINKLKDGLNNRETTFYFHWNSMESWVGTNIIRLSAAATTRRHFRHLKNQNCRYPC